MAELDPSKYAIGPTWSKNPDGTWKLPEQSLGWGLLAWAGRYLRQPDGPKAGQPFMFTPEQARFVLWWYAIDDNGRWLYRHGTFRRLKGAGKDPLVATFSLMELCGPVRFSRWEIGSDGTKRPVAEVEGAPWIQIAAVSQEQTRNTFSLFSGMCSEELKETYGLELHRTLIYSNGRVTGQIQAVTSSPHSLEGNRPTLVIMNETQFWYGNNNGHEMANAIDGNITKSAGGRARILSICNAHRPGEDSIAERAYEEWENRQRGGVDTRLLYDSLEAPPDTDIYDDASLRRGIEIARGDATWLDIDSLIDSIRDIRNPVSESRRKFLNHINAAEDSYLSPTEWGSVADEELALKPGDMITLGFDGSGGDDHTALVACRVEDAAIFVLNVWDPLNYSDENGDPFIPHELVDTAVEAAFNVFKVVGFYADSNLWESYIDKWSNNHAKKLKLKASPRHPIGFDMRSMAVQRRFSEAVENFYVGVLNHQIKHDGDPMLRWYALNAKRRVNEQGLLTIGKVTKHSKKKVDAFVAALIAYCARSDYMRTGRATQRKVTILR